MSFEGGEKVKCIKKPVIVEAIQFVDTVDRIVELSNFIDDQDLKIDYADADDPVVKIKTLEGCMKFRW